MELNLSDLTVLIELTQKEISELKQVMDQTDDDQLSEDSAICLVQIGNVAGKLKNQYEKLWTPNCNYPSYEELLLSDNGENT